MPVARRLAPAKPQATGRSLLPQVGRRRATSFRMSFHVSGKGARRAECLIFPWCEVPLFDAAARGGTVCIFRAGQRYQSTIKQQGIARAAVLSVCWILLAYTCELFLSLKRTATTSRVLDAGHRSTLPPTVRHATAGISIRLYKARLQSP